MFLSCDVERWEFSFLVMQFEKKTCVFFLNIFFSQKKNTIRKKLFFFASLLIPRYLIVFWWSGLAQLLTAATQGSQQDSGLAARDTASALQQLTYSVRAVQATTGEPQESLTSAARTVMQRCHNLLQEAHVVLNEGKSGKTKQFYSQFDANWKGNNVIFKSYFLKKL